MSAIDMVVFTRQISDLLMGGLSLPRCIDVSRRSLAGKRERALLGNILVDLETGKSLSASLESHGEFPPIYVGLVRAGESSGDLGGTFSRLAEGLEADDRIRSKIRNALIYPAIVLGLTLVVCLFLVLFVIPRFEFLFDELGKNLPWPTRVLIGATRMTREIGPAVAAIAVAALFSARPLLPVLRERATAVALRTRWMRSLFLLPFLSRWAATMSMLLAAGAAVPDALVTSRESLGSHPIASSLRAVEERIARGDSVAVAIQSIPAVPPIMIELVAAGEEAGSLPESLSRVSAGFERQADDRMQAAMAALEPLLIVSMAAIVGFVALAMLLPVFEMTSEFR